jgi:CTP:molybdopterin cytidylyltransferase MocA
MAAQGDDAKGPRVVILAAGHGTRMGGPKAFRAHGSRTFLERILARCGEGQSPITLVCDPRFRARIDAELTRLGAPPVDVAEADGLAPMLASVQAALAVPPSQDAAWRGGFWLWPVDAPFLSQAGWAAARETVHADPESVWKLRSGGKTGHPIWFPGWSVAPIRAGDWPDGLLGFLATCLDRVRILSLDDPHIFDVNTPEQLVRVPEDA